MLHAKFVFPSQAISGLATLALADAQQLTLLRAVAKGNQPQLIAAISADTAALFSQAGSQVGIAGVDRVTGCNLGKAGERWHGLLGITTSPPLLPTQPLVQVAAAPVPGASGSKLAAYCAYKAAYCSAYAHCFNGICLWKQQEKAGDGLKSVQAGMDALAAARKASSAYDAAPPASLNLHHRWAPRTLLRRCGCRWPAFYSRPAFLHSPLHCGRFISRLAAPFSLRRVDEDLEHVLLDTQRRMQRENDRCACRAV